MKKVKIYLIKFKFILHNNKNYNAINAIERNYPENKQ